MSNCLKESNEVATKTLTTIRGDIVVVEISEESFREFGFETLQAAITVWIPPGMLCTIEGIQRCDKHAIIWYTEYNSDYSEQFHFRKTEEELLKFFPYQEKKLKIKTLTTMAGNPIRVVISDEAFKKLGFKNLCIGKKVKDPYGFHCTIEGVGYLNDKQVICATRDGCQACMCFQPIEKNFKPI